MWYAIQTITGKEEMVKLLIKTCVSQDCYEDCRIFYSEIKKRYLGEWHIVKKVTFPGYLFIITDKVEELFFQLKKVPEMTKILGTGHDMVPIKPWEERFLKRLAGETETVSMSYGIQVGDKVTIMQGSLVGLEAMIRKIDRHKRKAWLEVDMFCGKKLLEFGLEILEKR